MDEQLTLDLQTPISYKKYSGMCECGLKWEYERCNIALDMYVICRKCKTNIKVGDSVKTGKF